MAEVDKEGQTAAHLAAEIERLLEAAAVALDSMDPSDLGAVLGEADALRLREPRRAPRALRRRGRLRHQVHCDDREQAV